MITRSPCHPENPSFCKRSTPFCVKYRAARLKKTDKRAFAGSDAAIDSEFAPKKATKSQKERSGWSSSPIIFGGNVSTFMGRIELVILGYKFS